MYEVSGQLQNHWCVTVNTNPVTIFVSQEKMQLRQVNENQIGFDINMGVTSSCEVTRPFKRSEVKFGACVAFNYTLTANTKSRPPNSCIFIVT